MVKKLIFVLALFVLSILYTIFVLYFDSPKEHRVLKIIRADLFYVDINDNSKIDKDELFKLDGIYAFSPELNNFTIENSKKLNISTTDYLKAGFVSQKWAKDNLENKNIAITSVIKDDTKNYNYAKVKFNGSDLSEFYLDNGLAYSKPDSDYLIYQNNNQIKNNIKEISRLKFVILNLNSKIFHKLNCELIELLRNAKLILLKEAVNYIPCKSCNNNKTINTPKTPLVNKVSFYKDFKDFELYFTNPLIYKKPDNTCSNEICKRLVKEINSAKESVDIALYGIGDIPEIFNSLKNAKEKGIKIRAVVDYSKKMDELYPKTKSFINEFGAHSDKSEFIMHNKFFIFDNKKVLTGSANISPSGIGGYSANSVVIINSEEIAKQYKEEFEQMYQGKFSNAKHKIEKIKSKNQNVYFSPKDDIKNVILSEINSAKEEICISAFYLTDKDIINSLIQARQRGVNVFIILDAVSANIFKKRVYLIRNSGIALKVENWGGKDHEKTILIDKKTLILGSLNFSSAGLNKNDENIVIIKNNEAAIFYRNYFFYLYNSIDDKFLRFIPRSEGKESKNSCTDGVDNNFDGKIDKEDEGCM